MFTVKRILCPVDIGSKHLGYLSNALDMAKTFGSDVHFLYVNGPEAGYRHPVVYENEMAGKMKSFLPDEQLGSLRAYYAVARGNVGEEVKKYCAANKIDLIIAGHKHRSKLYSSMFDSCDVNIVDAVRTPVVILPE